MGKNQFDELREWEKRFDEKQRRVRSLEKKQRLFFGLLIFVLCFLATMLFRHV